MNRRETRGLSAVVLVVCSVLVSSCASHYRYTYQSQARPQPETKAAHPFEYERRNISFSNDDLDDTWRYNRKNIQFDSIGINGQPGNKVSALYYKGKRDGKKSLVIILPIWGTYTYPSREVAQGIRRRFWDETNVLMMLGEHYLFNWDAANNISTENQFEAYLQDMTERIRTSTIDVRRLIDWAEQQPEIDPNKIAIVGFSLSAVMAGNVAAIDPRPAATVIVMGSTHIGGIVASCDGRLETLKHTIMNALQWDAGRYREKAVSVTSDVDLDNVYSIGDPSRILMIESAYDTCMPQPGRNALWWSLGRPERISYRYNHRKAFLSMTPLGLFHMRYQIYEFLKESMQLDDDA